MDKMLERSRISTKNQIIPFEQHNQLNSIKKILLQQNGEIITLIDEEAAHFQGRGIQSIDGIEKFSRLVILDLSHNRIKDIAVLRNCAPTMVSLNLSNNVISNLLHQHFWSLFQSLQKLDLSNNYLKSWKITSVLKSIDNLIHLSLHSNPVASKKGYRKYFVNMIPKLRALDFNVVTDEEKIKGADFGTRFGSMTKYTKLLDSVHSQAKTIEEMQYNLRQIRRIYERNSPSIWCQRIWKGFHARNGSVGFQLSHRPQLVFLQAWIRGFLFRHRMKQQIYNLLVQQKQLNLLANADHDQLTNAVNIIVKWYRSFQHGGSKKKVAAKVLQQWYRRNRTKWQKKKEAIDTLCEYYLLFQEEDYEQLISTVSKAIRVDRYLSRAFHEEHDVQLYIRSRIATTDYHLIRPLKYVSRDEDKNRFECDGILRKTSTQFLPVIEHKLRCLQNDIFCSNMLGVNNQLLQLMEEKLLILQEQKEALQLKELTKTIKKRKTSIIRNRGFYPTSQEKHLFKSNINQTISIKSIASNLVSSILSKSFSSSSNIKNRKFSSSYLQIFSAPTARVFHHVLFLAQFNHLMVLKSLDAERIINATLIQCQWRAYKTRQLLRPSLITRRMRRRAAVCIQRWWRYQKGLKKYFNFIKVVCEYAATITGKVLWMEEESFHLLMNPRLFQTLLSIPKFNIPRWILPSSKISCFFENVQLESFPRNTPLNLKHPSTEANDEIVMKENLHSNYMSYQNISYSLLKLTKYQWNHEIRFDRPMARLEFPSKIQAKNEALLLFFITYPNNIFRLYSFPVLISLYVEQKRKEKQINISENEMKVLLTLNWSLAEKNESQANINRKMFKKVVEGNKKDINLSNVIESGLDSNRQSSQIKRMIKEMNQKKQELSKEIELERKKIKFAQVQIPHRPASPYNYERLSSPCTTESSLISERKEEEIQLKKNQVYGMRSRRIRAQNALHLEKAIVERNKSVAGGFMRLELNSKLEKEAYKQEYRRMEMCHRKNIEKGREAQRHLTRRLAQAFQRECFHLSRHMDNTNIERKEKEKDEQEKKWHHVQKIKEETKNKIEAIGEEEMVHKNQLGVTTRLQSQVQMEWRKKQETKRIENIKKHKMIQHKLKTYFHSPSPKTS